MPGETAGATGDGLSGEQERVLAANEAFYAAFNDRDAEAMEALWAREHPVACVHPNWKAILRRDQVMDSWRAIMRNPDQPRLVVGGAEARVIDSVAYVVCRELVAGTPLAATNIFALEDGEWRVIHHHSSPVALPG